MSDLILFFVFIGVFTSIILGIVFPAPLVSDDGSFHCSEKLSK
jgi:hypothetical protein